MAKSRRVLVLVVDDDPDLLTLVTALLSMNDCQVETAMDGQQAFAAIERQMPTLILLDMRMPNMNGWQFAAKFHEKYDHKAPIVVLTAAPHAEEIAAEIGAEGWIAKPFEVERILDTVRQFT